MKKIIGDCESGICSSKGVELTLQHHNILMCKDCVAKEAEAIAQSKAAKVIETSHRVDSKLELKQDLFNAGTVSFVELSAAIENNVEIPVEQKNISIMQEVASRIDKLNAVIFERDEATLALKNERHALLVNAQIVAAKLHEKEQEKYKQYRVDYKPQTPKGFVKPKSVVVKKAFDKVEVYKAAKKYGVSATDVQMRVVAGNNRTPDKAAEYLLGQVAEKYKVPASNVLSIVTAQNKSAEEAAKQFAEQMGIL